MKSYRSIKVIAFWMVVAIAFFGGSCTYNVEEPLWYNREASTDSVSISGLDPLQATPGYNYITINGQNFGGALDTAIVHNVSQNNDTAIIYNGVYFGSLRAEIVDFSPTSIRVRRPNLATDTCIVKIVPDNTLLEAKYGPYRIDPVYEAFGGFVSNAALSTITMDNSGNLYVAESTTRYLWKVAPNGQSTQIGANRATPFALTRVPTDAKVGPDGKFYYMNGVFPNTKEIRMVDLSLAAQADSLATDSLWYTTSPVKNVTCGDFDANGYLYAGGPRSGIVVIRPNRTQRADGYYATDTILSVRVFSGYLYVALRTGIWRHSLSDTSLVGAQEQVLDWTSTPYASLPIRSFSFSSDGSKVYIGTNSQYPIIIADVTGLPIPASRVDIMYKDILPTYCKQLSFGDALYMISGNASPSVTWNVYRVDVGTTGAPYY
jgi:hypothetical protein